MVQLLLDGLGQDAVMSVLGNLDAKTLFRLGKVSKYFRFIVVGKRDDGGLLRAAVLNSFPGITNVPLWEWNTPFTRVHCIISITLKSIVTNHSKSLTLLGDA